MIRHSFRLARALPILAVIGCANQRPLPTTSISVGDNAEDHTAKDYVELRHPSWTKNATIYEVNLRQQTAEGTFKAFTAHLPRLKRLGVDIVWLMPIHPIGVKHRKGALGSYYAVRDYYGVNEELGTLADFKALVEQIHRSGMRVIMDWVANHSAWDNPLVAEHPEWYSRGPDGEIQSTPWRDYDDIVDFDYRQPGLRRYMTEAMKYWVREADIDGYRCDMASFVPIEFWENARKELDHIKPVFMLAEAADRDLHRRAFDMTYSFSLWDQLHAITTGKRGLQSLTEGYIAEHVSTWPPDAYRMNFVDNHDKNAWEGNQFSNFGEGLEAAIVLTVTLEGMPLLYGGQEAGLDRSVKFFEKDPIVWKEHRLAQLYTQLFALKHANRALWNGGWGGPMIRVKNSNPSQVISFVREKDAHRVITIVNLSGDPQQITLQTGLYAGQYREVFTNKAYTLRGDDRLAVDRWGYLVLTRP